MKSRLMTLLMAVITGAVAVASVYLYVQRVEDDSARGLRPRKVLVAARSFEAGTAGSEIRRTSGALMEESIPADFIVDGALDDPSFLDGKFLTGDLASGEQLLETDFSGSPSGAFASLFPEGTQALSLPVEQVRGVAGHVSAGDKLNAYAARDDTTALIAENVSVVEVQPPPSEDLEAPATMVLAVTAEDAIALIDAQEHAGLWFTLITHPEGTS
ncbi:MAG TPA: RcpC/CpaB family pilus assembly protein [Actinomycetota bacterium]|nr:RcpC/CpaB family pilus assembly protein [Actinomycetota bacterium]